MIKKLTLLTGIAAGYVLGAKAGQERYEQIKTKFGDLMGKPQVQQATETLQHAASDLADRAKETVNDKVDQVTGKTVDLTDGTSNGYGKAPIEGAAASGSVL